MTDQTAQLDWRQTPAGPVPVSTRFDDPYFSLDNGLAETTHVFLQGNDLPARFSDDFRIAELGFGTGLNFLATVAAWRGTPGRHLRFTSFEAFPMTADDMRHALSAFPTVSDDAARLVSLWSDAQRGPVRFDDGIMLHVITGDARTTLTSWEGHADAWYLDGFSPAKNPELWGNDLMQAVADRTSPGGTVATYTAAGHVRRALTDAGLTVTRVPGFGRKRHMTTAQKPA